MPFLRFNKEYAGGQGLCALELVFFQFSIFQKWNLTRRIDRINASESDLGRTMKNMRTDIDLLKEKIDSLELKMSTLESQLTRAIELISKDPTDPESTIVKSRVILEKVTKEIYSKIGIEIPKKGTDLGGLLNNNQFTRKLPPRIVLRMNSVREYGNLGAHDKGPVSMSDAIDCLKCLVEILDWYCEEYLELRVPLSFDDRKSKKGLTEVPTKENDEFPIYQKYSRAIVVAICCLIVLALSLTYMFSQRTEKAAERTMNQKEVTAHKMMLPHVEDILIKGISKEIKTALQLAYGAKLKEVAPSAAFTVIVKDASNTSKTWRPLRDDEALSSADNYKIMFCPEETTFFYVFQIDSSGKLDWLFPKNRTSPYSSGSNPVPGSLWITLPNGNKAFHLDENQGIEHVYIVAATKRWRDLEVSLRGAAQNDGDIAPINFSLGLQTRGVGGERFIESTPPKYINSNTNDVRQLVQGKDGVLVVEKWFKHIATPETRKQTKME